MYSLPPPQYFCCLAAVLIYTGCAIQEHRFAATELPVELQAEPWLAPCTLPPFDNTADRVDPQLGRGDEVEVLLSSGLHVSETTRVTAIVRDDGSVDVPAVGRVKVSGATPETAGQLVKQAGQARGVADFSVVQVRLKKPHQYRITVIGAIKNPGTYELPWDNSDLLSALAAAGGLSRDSGARIVIRSRTFANGSGRSATAVESAVFEQYQEPQAQQRAVYFTAGTLPSLGIEELRDGDTVMVDRRDPPSVLVSGMVSKPGRYEFPIGQEFRIMDAISSAGGPAHKVIDTVMVCRTVPDKPDRAIIVVSLHKATRSQNENIPLQPGDIVSVEPNPKMLAEDSLKYVGTATVGVLIGTKAIVP